jgi:hypothetical protein
MPSAEADRRVEWRMVCRPPDVRGGARTSGCVTTLCSRGVCCSLLLEVCSLPASVALHLSSSPSIGPISPSTILGDPRLTTCSLRQRSPHKFKPVARLWLLLHGISLWTIWITRNHFVFQGERWSQELVQSLIWKGIGEYSRAIWSKCVAQITMDPLSKPKLLACFDAQWTKYHLICTKEDMKVTWIRHDPVTGIG